MKPISGTKKGSSLPGVVQWKPVYSVGIAFIDQQHQMLVSMIAHLQEAMLEGRTRQVVAPLFAAMNLYTQYHFQAEEQLLEENGYPGWESHRELHNDLIAQLKDLEKRYIAGTLNAGAPLMHFLKTWLVDHIGAHDKEFAPFLKDRGAS